ncbi:MAG: hypothetical protein ACKPKO_48750, partial [Candidatus Fonsibacter sp.]
MDVGFVTFVARWFTARKSSGHANLAAHKTFIRRLHPTDAKVPMSPSDNPSAEADSSPSCSGSTVDVSTLGRRRTGSLSTDEYVRNEDGEPVWKHHG